MAEINNSNSTLLLEKKRSLTPSVMEEVRTLSISECEGAAQCLAEAFAVDEVARYFVDTPDMENVTEAAKWKLHLSIMRYMTAAHCYKGIVTTVGDDYGAVALWMQPAADMDDWLTFFRSGLWRLYYQLSSEGRVRFFKEFFPLLHDTKHNVMGERDGNSYYLVYLGSKASARGKGYARKLIEHMTVKADSENRATYLESSAHGNLSYYEKYGFVHKSDIQLERGPKPIKLHIMVREPVNEAEGSKGGERVGGRML
ncbi:Acyl-CoA N-acyltransferases (Nat) [Glarea lozoyensis ATCC 20868]|uniref:Acyl-CoA N-acyltransferases (Nat) n=1 Tax=Glarea lozoyensis (strain ATCC 20868 / MF5171) TaxID=1116229 RepID=S3CCS4_GLAL2|nr:Acyl-CoA N-acyltransferases (Nat) [Glarea lozoyensis ATCC 20868]EPE24327.1 Acyl-CoA N-acyltransferases (Nat) [Glarea lozoyensis ATCC 20868]